MNQQFKLILYYRSGCGLCEEMQAELFTEQSQHGFELETIDVDSSEALVAQFGHKVPVLTSATGEEICHYFLDHSALADCFSGG